eukprot:7612780-Prorocentrum_lima.AAC.1
MMTKKGKSKMNLTKACWMKNFVHLHGTSLKSDTKTGSRDLKGKVKGVSVMNMEANATQEEDWSQCAKEQ